MAEPRPSRQLPSGAQGRRERQSQERVDVAELRRRRDSRDRIAAAEVAKTPAGRVFITMLFNLCGYNRSSIASDPVTGDLQPDATYHNEAMRLVYLKVRAKLPPDLRAQIEAAAEQEGETLMTEPTAPQEK